MTSPLGWLYLNEYPLPIPAACPGPPEFYRDQFWSQTPSGLIRVNLDSGTGDHALRLPGA